MRPPVAPLRNWLNTGLGFFYPEICQLCEAERATASEGFVGAKCWTQVRFIRPPFCERCGLPYPGDLTTPFECTNCRELELHFTSARSAVVAKSVVLEVIHRFKYQRALWFENFLADLFLREAVPVLRGQGWDFIVPVPLIRSSCGNANSIRLPGWRGIWARPPKYRWRRRYCTASPPPPRKPGSPANNARRT